VNPGAIPRIIRKGRAHGSAPPHGETMEEARIADEARLLPAGDTALVVEFGDRIDRALSARVNEAGRRVLAARLEGVVELVPSFRSLLVHYDPLATSQAALAEAIGALAMPSGDVGPPPRTWHVPVLYGGEAGPDLAAVAAAAGLTEAEAVALHSGTTYHVYALGFLPGYAYLGDLPERLRLPRRATPRVRVPAGSVAIAEALTGVYPRESPGGWHLLGNCPLRLFDPAAARPSLFEPGEAVRFEPVTAAEHAAIAGDVARGAYRPRFEEAAA
jgi:KipI family sensor histidine kinase inhibitor